MPLMRIPGAAVLVLVLLAGGCGGESADDDSPSRDTPKSSATTKDETTPAKALAQAIRQLNNLPAVSFSAGFQFGGRPGISTDGIAVQGGAWSATTVLDYLDVHERVRVRSVDGNLWAQDPSWEEPARGCWAQLEEAVAPFNIAAQAAGLIRPGYVTMLDQLKPLKWESALHNEVVAKLPIAAVLRLLPGAGVDGLSGDEPVRVTVAIDDDRVSQLLVQGSDINAAIKKAGLPEPGGSIAQFRVYYDEADGPATVARPSPDQVTGDLSVGCGHSA